MSSRERDDPVINWQGEGSMPVIADGKGSVKPMECPTNLSPKGIHECADNPEFSYFLKKKKVLKSKTNNPVHFVFVSVLFLPEHKQNLSTQTDGNQF